MTASSSPLVPAERPRLTVGLSNESTFLSRQAALALQRAGCRVELFDSPVSESNAEGADSALEEILSRVDVYVHIAEDIVASTDPSDGNATPSTIEQAWKLVWACDALEEIPRLIVAYPQGQSRGALASACCDEAAEVILEFARREEINAVCLRFPEVFGPGQQATSHATVASIAAELCAAPLETAATAIKLNSTSSSEDEPELELIFVADLADEIADYATFPADESGMVTVHGEFCATRSELIDELTVLCDNYFASGVVPDFTDDTRRSLYATLLSYLPASARPVPLQRLDAPGGSLIEVLRTETAGRVTLLTILPGERLGDHYHARSIERLAIVRGKAAVTIESVVGSATATHTVDAFDPEVFTIPPMHAYRIENTGPNEVVIIAWASELIDPAHPDSHPYPIAGDTNSHRDAA